MNPGLVLILYTLCCLALSLSNNGSPLLTFHPFSQSRDRPILWLVRCPTDSLHIWSPCCHKLMRSVLGGLYPMSVHSILGWTYDSENMDSGPTSKLTEKPQAKEQTVRNMWALCQAEPRGCFLMMKPRQVPEIFEHSLLLLCEVWAIIMPTS